MFNEKWTNRFLELAEHVSRWSKDPSTKVGAAIIRPDKTICSVGFNGFPPDMDDDPALYANREEKYKRIIHGEINAINFACEPLFGYCLFTWPFLPCSVCADKIKDTGILHVVAPKPSKDVLSRWGDSLKETKRIFKENDIAWTEI